MDRIKNKVTGKFQRAAMSRACFGLALVVLLAGWPAPLSAGSDLASPWNEAKYARVRLVAGGAGPGGTRMVGVQIELDEGWYTYWRNPGEAGVPPVFNWTGSENFSKAQVKYPAPKRLVSEYGVSYGYYGGTVFPIAMTPNADGPMQLKLDLIYAACRDICYPLQANLSLTLPAAPSSSTFFSRMVDAALSRVPTQQPATGAPRVASAIPAMAGGKVILKVKTELARAGEKAELFVEGPDRFYFRVPGEAATRDGQMATFEVAVEGARAIADLKGAAMTATLVAPSGRVETRWVVE